MLSRILTILSSGRSHWRGASESRSDDLSLGVGCPGVGCPTAATKPRTAAPRHIFVILSSGRSDCRGARSERAPSGFEMRWALRRWVARRWVAGHWVLFWPPATWVSAQTRGDRPWAGRRTTHGAWGAAARCRLPSSPLQVSTQWSRQQRGGGGAGGKFSWGALGGVDITLGPPGQPLGPAPSGALGHGALGGRRRRKGLRQGLRRDGEVYGTVGASMPWDR